MAYSPVVIDQILQSQFLIQRLFQRPFDNQWRLLTVQLLVCQFLVSIIWVTRVVLNSLIIQAFERLIEVFSYDGVPDANFLSDLICRL